MSNHLVFMADNLSKEVARAAMPFLNGEFAAMGTRYNRFYNPVPECTPSRVALMTGQYPHNNLCFQNGELFGVGGRPAETDTLAPVLNSSTYNVMVGKQYDFSLGAVSRPGFDYQRMVSANWQRGYGFSIWDGSSEQVQTQTHAATYVGNIVAQQIDDPITTPFFIWAAPTVPHPNFTTVWRSKPSFASGELFWSSEPEIPFLTDTTAKPSWIASRPEPTEEQKCRMRQEWQSQCRSARDVDNAFRHIVEALDTYGFLSTTIIYFVSDNGVMFGRQRMDYGTDGTQDFNVLNANVLYEPLINTPCIIAGPGFTAGTESDDLVMMADVTATILDDRGITPTLTLDGQSLLDPVSPSRQLLCAQRQTDIAPVCDGIITATRRLVRYDDTGDDEFEMYDLDTDPDELLNVANDPSRLTERNALEADLDALLA